LDPPGITSKKLQSKQRKHAPAQEGPIQKEKLMLWARCRTKPTGSKDKEEESHLEKKFIVLCKLEKGKGQETKTSELQPTKTRKETPNVELRERGSAVHQ